MPTPYCDQPHPVDDAEAVRWCLMYHRPGRNLAAAPDMRTQYQLRTPRSRQPEQGVSRCECGCKYWNADGRCVDCDDRWDPAR